MLSCAFLSLADLHATNVRVPAAAPKLELLAQRCLFPVCSFRSTPHSPLKRGIRSIIGRRLWERAEQKRQESAFTTYSSLFYADFTACDFDHEFSSECAGPYAPSSKTVRARQIS
jgi:hypothetical protein